MTLTSLRSVLRKLVAGLAVAGASMFQASGCNVDLDIGELGIPGFNVTDNSGDIYEPGGDDDYAPEPGFDDFPSFDGDDGDFTF